MAKWFMRWVAAALKEAHAHFRRMRGHRDLKHLATALDVIRAKELDKKGKKASHAADKVRCQRNSRRKHNRAHFPCNQGIGTAVFSTRYSPNWPASA